MIERHELLIQSSLQSSPHLFKWKDSEQDNLKSDIMLQERELTDGAFAFYNLTADWLLRQASSSYASGLQNDVSLPAEAPLSFRALPVGFPPKPWIIIARQ